MKLYPDYYCKNVTEITLDFLNKNNIKGLILDVDNTLIDKNKKILDGAIKWHEKMRENGIKSIILSNSNKLEKVKNVANALNIDFINLAKKPLKSGFKKAKSKLGLKEENIAVVGDQIFTDVIGANRCNMFSILVEPVSKEDLLITKWKRPIENYIIKKYLKSLENKS